MSNELNIAEALNFAIWLRNNCDEMDKDKIKSAVVELGAYGIFSSRQIHAIVNKNINRKAITELIGKTDRSGGALNPGTLDLLRSVLVNRATQETDYILIRDAVGSGTSQHMVSKLTGVPQSTISKIVKRDNG